MHSTKTHRLFISLFFLISGISYSTLMARIPTLKAHYNLNDLELGTLLLTLPISSMIGLPLAGWLISRYSSKRTVSFAFGLNTITLIAIGYAPTLSLLVLTIAVFGFTMRVFSISVNAQAIGLQKLYEKKIVGSFHGLWSLGGIFGIGITTLMVAVEVNMPAHFAFISILNLGLTVYAAQFLLEESSQGAVNKFKLGKPDTLILYLGIIAFLGAMCEGAMYDWSGVYFRDVLNIKVFTYGYLIFMSFMTASRFASDFMMNTIGLKRYYLMNAVLICVGMTLPALLPTFFWAVLGFCLVGIGTAPIVPMTYILASANSKYAPSISISIIATYALMGMFLGPPLVGFLAHQFDLQMSFLALSIVGISILPIAVLFFRHLARTVPAEGP